MRKFNLKTPLQVPSSQQVGDAGARAYLDSFAKNLIKTVRDILDDLKQLEKTERITALFTPTKDNYGKWYILEGTGSAGDSLYLCVDTGSETYVLRKVF